GIERGRLPRPERRTAMRTTARCRRRGRHIGCIAPLVVADEDLGQLAGVEPRVADRVPQPGMLNLECRRGASVCKAAASGGHAEPLVMGSDALLPVRCPFSLRGI